MIELSVPCPLLYEDASQYEGKVWRECGEELEIEVDYSCYLPPPEWRIGMQPNGCPHGHDLPWTDAERTELGKRIVDAYERWGASQEMR